MFAQWYNYGCWWMCSHSDRWLIVNVLTQWQMVSSKCVCTMTDGELFAQWLMMNISAQCWMVYDECVHCNWCWIFLSVTNGWWWMCLHGDRWLMVNVMALWQMVDDEWVQYRILYSSHYRKLWCQLTHKKHIKAITTKTIKNKSSQCVKL